jgi:addiction module HigA family antidote
VIAIAPSLRGAQRRSNPSFPKLCYGLLRFARNDGTICCHICSDADEVEIVEYKKLNLMAPIVHPGRLLKRELAARKLSANRLSLDIGVPSGRITDILNGRRSITADTAVRLGRYFGNNPQFWLDLQGQYDIGVVEKEKGAEIVRRIRPADAA